jgi:hypothetical protein
MRTISYVVCSTIALSIVMVSSANSFAKAYQPDSNDVSRRTGFGCMGNPCLLDGTLVVGAPFSAEVTTVWHPPAASGRAELQAASRLYRDSVGRVRVEQDFVQDQRSHRIILTPDNKTAYLLDPVARTTTNPGPRGLAELLVGYGAYSQFVLPISMSRSVGFFAIPDVPPDATNAAGGESLGERTIAGVQATGTRFVTRLPAGVTGFGRAERWVSPELKLVVYSRIEDAAIGVVEYQVTRISRSDPPADLFEVPEDYVETPLKLHFVVENPYTPKTSLIR